MVIEKPYSIRFTIPSAPPSVNSLYQVIFSLKKIQLKPEVMIWKSQSKMFVPVWRPVHDSKTGFLYFHMTVHTDLYYKNSKVRRLDLGNMEKACLDMVCERIGIDDSFVTRRVLEKVQRQDNEQTEIEIGFVD